MKQSIEYTYTPRKILSSLKPSTHEASNGLGKGVSPEPSNELSQGVATVTRTVELPLTRGSDGQPFELSFSSSEVCNTVVQIGTNWTNQLNDLQPIDFELFQHAFDLGAILLTFEVLCLCI